LHHCLSFLEKEADEKQQTRRVTRELLFSRCLNHQRFRPSVLVTYEREFHSGLLTWFWTFLDSCDEMDWGRSGDERTAKIPGNY